MVSGPRNVPKRVILGFLTQVIVVIISIILIKQQLSVKKVID